MEYWKLLNLDGTTNSVESHSFPHVVPKAVKITEQEYGDFIASLPPPLPEVNPEIEDIKARLKALEDSR